MINYIECLKTRLIDGTVRVKPELFLFCLDSKDAYYYDKNGERIIFTEKLIRFNTEEEFRNAELELGKVYAVSETKTLYNNERYILNLEEELLDNDFTSSMVGGILENNGVPIAPVTLGTSVFHKNTQIQAALRNVNEQIFHKIQVDNRYVEVTKNNQRIFEIPFPFLNYTIGLNQMEIVFNNKVVNNLFQIEDRMVTLREDVEKNYFKKNDVLLFIFMYNTSITMNDFIINNSNLSKGCINDDNLSAGIQIPATNIIETTNKKFVSETEKETWNDKAENIVASYTRNGLLSSIDYSKIQTLSEDFNNITKLITGTSVVLQGTSSLSVPDSRIDENSFIIVSCKDDYIATVTWDYTHMAIKLNKTATANVTVHWLIVNPKS